MFLFLIIIISRFRACCTNLKIVQGSRMSDYKYYLFSIDGLFTKNLQKTFEHHSIDFQIHPEAIKD